MKIINVEVAYASTDKQFLLPASIAEKSSIEEAIEASGLLTLCQEINLSAQKVGVFGEKRHLSDLVSEGDRIEIYRPLLIDPKEIRRIKAKRKSS
jgi:putative ubiquitin-RnfH superfamily antitoxin RatB of RatAB toxin-antitoxin module